MKALLSHAAGGPETLVLGDRPMPTAGRGELLVRVLVWAQALGAYHFAAVDALGLRWVAEFMSYLPFVARAADQVVRVAHGCAALLAARVVFGCARLVMFDV